MSDEEQINFLQCTLPGIIKLALQLPDLIQAPIPLLQSGTNGSVSFSQQQIASLLANAFLCTFPRRNAQKKGAEYRSYPEINFSRLFSYPNPSVLEKIKCLLNYFQRVSTHGKISQLPIKIIYSGFYSVPKGVVTVSRRCMSSEELPSWNVCGADFDHIMANVSSDGTIEDQGNGLLQVDFANKYLGGGVLGCGCVQEEIRFVICPELFITKLIAEVMQPNEAIFIIGCERYSEYSGYSNKFEFNGNFYKLNVLFIFNYNWFLGEYDDKTPWDDSRRKMCSIVAIDALQFRDSADQYREDLMIRELNKVLHTIYYVLLTTKSNFQFL